MKHFKIYIGLTSFVFLFFAGYFISKKSWDGNFFIYLDNTYSPSISIDTRTIASVSSDNAHISLKKVKEDDPSNNHFSVINNENTIQLYLTHLLIKTPGGGRVLACQKYQKVDLTFIASEMAVHGHTPEMVLKTDCNFDTDTLQMGPFLIPKKKILKSPISQQLFSSNNSALLFHHVSFHWPEKWILSQIRFIGKNQADYYHSFTGEKEEDFVTFYLR